MSDKDDWEVKCPFYLNDNYTYIRCEGIVGMNTTNWFKNKKEMNIHKARYCRRNFRECPLHETLKDKYE